MAATQTTQPKKKPFSSFSYRDAFKQLNLTQLAAWQSDMFPVPASGFFQEHMQRLQCFDLSSSEESKKLIIDAILAEAIQTFKHLKIWKGAALESDIATGEADYLISEHKAYLEAPFVCIVEAKRDDFYQGLAQCLVEMQACQWNNQQLGKTFDSFGIVTNGEGWKFYKLSTDIAAYETPLYSISNLDSVLGWLHYIFQHCEQNLNQ